MKFEEMLKRLERLIEELEDEEVSLDESLKKYEEGIRLLKLCRNKLDSMKKRVEVLLKKEDGRIEAKPFEPR
jgi:exodeoxyribonuclease VII small subunit